MWPDIKYRKENNESVGYDFDSKFWKIWGPAYMYYYNENIYDNSKPIKAICCMYNNHNSVEFVPEEIAMGLKYECGDFGEHVVLFSYVDAPKLNYKPVWDFFVFPECASDNEEEIFMHKLSFDIKEGNISKEEAYIMFLEKNILGNKKGQNSESLYELSENIIKIFQKSHPDISDEEAYKILLEKIIFCGYGNGGIGKIDISSRGDFEKSVYEVITKYKPFLKCQPSQKFENDLARIEKYKTKNDLDLIFRNCREYFKNLVQKDCKVMVNKPIWDKETYEHIGTEAQEVEIGVDGYIEKDKHGKVKFYQYEKNREK